MYMHFTIFWLFAGSGTVTCIFDNTVIPVAMGIADIAVFKAQMHHKNCVSIFSGGGSAYLKHLGEYFMSRGDWVLQCDPFNSAPNIT